MNFSNLYGKEEKKSFKEEKEEIINKTWMKIGPFRIYPLIMFKNIGYDDNVYYQPENPVKDYTGTFSPNFNIYLLFKNRIIFSIFENPEYVYYLREKRYCSFNNVFRTQMKIALTRFVLSGKYMYANVKTRASSEFDYRVRYIQNIYSVGISYMTPRKTFFDLETSRRKISFKEEVYKGEFYLPKILNRREDSLSFTMYYRIFSRTFFVLKTQYTKYIFEFEESWWRNSEAYNFSAGFLFPKIGPIQGKLNLGYKTLWRIFQKEERFEGLIGDTNLTLKIHRFLFRINYLRDCFFSYYPNNFYFIEDRYGGGASFYLSRNIRLDYDYIVGYLNYSNLVKVKIDGEIKEIFPERETILQSGGVVFRLIRNIGLGITINMLEWRGDIYKGMKRTFIGAFLTYEF